ncbi:MAG TPA: hypothetical protein VKG84_01650 [Candidatus Acidoferrales bacterium]|nr:hypothetical protein [Candidatus Acidoferrales bacterium]
MKSKAAVLVLCVFLAGAVVGGLSVHLFGENMFHTGASPTSYPMTKGEILRQFDRQLALSPAQHAQISGILDDTVTEYNRLYSPISIQIEDARQQGRTRIRAVLTPEQLSKFEAYIHQLDEQRALLEKQHEK